MNSSKFFFTKFSKDKHSHRLLYQGFFFCIISTLIMCSSFVIAEGGERPAFNSLRKIGTNIEIREYLESKWSCTTSSNTWFQDSNMFWNLFYYIQGKNDQNLKVYIISVFHFYFHNFLLIYIDANDCTSYFLV